MGFIEELKRLARPYEDEEMDDFDDFEPVGRSNVVKEKARDREATGALFDQDAAAERLAEDGMVVLILNIQNGQLITDPEVITRGFIYVKESEELMRELKEVAKNAALTVIGKRSRDMGELRGAVKSAVSGYLFKHTKRSPMVIPVVNKL